MGDDGSLLECLGSSPTLPHLTASDSARLTVHYVPQASISIEGGEGSEAGLEAGDSASLTCSARANPPAYNFTFLLNGRPLHRANVVESGQSLTLLEVTHKDAGLYTCVASNSEGDGQSNAVPLHIDFPPVCAWEGVKEVLAVVGEKVRMECKVLASPPDVTFTWEKVTFTANMTQLRSPLQHDDSGLTSTGWATAEGNLSSTQGAMRAECQPRNDLGKADHPCVFAIRIVGDPSPLTGCYHHDVTADSASVTCEDVTSPGYLANTYHIQVREGGLVAATFNNSVPRFNLTSLAPGRDYTLVLHASHAKGRGPDTFLTLRTHTPKAEQVAPERVPVEPVKKPGEDAPQPTDSPRGPGGTPLSVVVSGAVVGVVVGVAVVVAGVVTCRARRGHASSPGKAHHHHHHNVSRDSLLERPSPGVLFQPYGGSSPPSCELLTTFSPGPVVVTQVTSARSSRRSSPLMRKSSTRSAPGGSSPRGIRPRAASCRGGPVHVLEVEADDVTTPRVEVHSPSRLSRLSLRNLRRRGSQPIMTREPQAVLTVESQALGLEVPPAVPAQQPQPAVPAECQQVPDTTQDTAGQTEEQKFESLQPPVSPLNPQTDAPRPQGDTTQPPPPLTGPYVHLTPPPGHASPAPPCQTQPPPPSTLSTTSPHTAPRTPATHPHHSHCVHRSTQSPSPSPCTPPHSHTWPLSPLSSPRRRPPSAPSLPSFAPPPCCSALPRSSPSRSPTAPTP
ncbi:nascent polypeptide-associated complex subunit alpha, muscle-specific form-like [Scylla paramamosain]|uniref:nascent polypeptide-associated complex subunit alpha, muscle-specific form-like n=1 Tax=Scylla paramamosain TaxID=85552 RepID=UPI003082985E